MAIDKASFLLALATLGVGGAGGYVASEEGAIKRIREPGVMERQGADDSTTHAAGTTASAPPAAPLCDDMAGAPAACPSPGYSADEGQGCGVVASKRCEDFKQTMKPRVAEQAVACLNALTPGQRCDAARVNLCAHQALMSACSESDAPQSAALAAPAVRDEVTSRCDGILRSCSGTMLAPTMRECRETLAGLNTRGRDQMSTCMNAHCGDRGLVGCEAIVDVK
ncbi:MAG TPA: hypothetical protein VIF09_11090 [Polyangiaceae bacterium]|jgi:hypothetical protein